MGHVPFNREIDPETEKAYDEFKRLEPSIFLTAPNQEDAEDIYFSTWLRLRKPRQDAQQIIKRIGQGEKVSVTLHAGTVIQRGGVYQVLLKPYTVQVASVRYENSTSEQLPDGSIVHLPTRLILL